MCKTFFTILFSILTKVFLFKFKSLNLRVNQRVKIFFKLVIINQYIVNIFFIIKVFGNYVCQIRIYCTQIKLKNVYL